MRLMIEIHQSLAIEGTDGTKICVIFLSAIYGSFYGFFFKIIYVVG